MGFRESSRYCPNCKLQRLVRQETPDITVHVLITLLSCGLWGFVWLALTLMASANPWRCSVCGSPTSIPNRQTNTRTQKSGFEGFTTRRASTSNPITGDALQKGSGFLTTWSEKIRNLSTWQKVALIIVGLWIVAAIVLPSVIGNKDKTEQIATQPTIQTALSTPNAQASPTRARQSSTPTPTPEPEAFNTDTSKQILASFFIKPVLLEMLNNPDSLQDLRIISIRPVRKMAGVYRATVFYRAENGFGALVAQEQTFMVTRGTGTGLDAWRVTPVKD